MKRTGQLALGSVFALFAGLSTGSGARELVQEVFECDLRVETFDESGHIEKTNKAQATYIVDIHRQMVTEVNKPSQFEVMYPITTLANNKIGFGKSMRVISDATEISQSSVYIIDRQKKFLEGLATIQTERIINEETGRYKRSRERRSVFGTCTNSQ